ncbi:MAG: ABC transporter ATP-binding protein [Rhodocyclales bacterium]|nr:ABC transporter ATP-binding protein [Rhodocyclales bacterium]
MTTAINVCELKKDYRKGWRGTTVSALRGISLCVDQGESFGFVGPNGAGKSTTIKILVGLAEATAGTAEIFGVSVHKSAARMGVGYVPENPYLYDYLTPLEILTMSLRLHQVQVPDIKSQCAVWLERLGLAQVASRPIRTFSKGMTQRVAIAQALCIKPRLLVLDEPLSGLDPIGRRDVVDILAEYKQAGGTLFFTSHVLHDVERLADRFGLIHQGELRAVRSPAELAGEEESLSVRSLGVKPVEGMRSDSAGRWVGEVARSGLWALLAALRDADHVVLEVRPALSLENAFMRAIGADRK